MNCGLRVQLHSRPGTLQRDLARIDALWKEGLARLGGPFLAGDDFTAVDAFYAPVMFRVQTYQLPLSPLCGDYVARMLALPGMQEWYAAALAETWRDESHEEDVRRVGVILEDLRA